MQPHEIRNRYILRNPRTMKLLQHFAEADLHPELKDIVTPIRLLAFDIVDNTIDGEDLNTALTRLLEAKEWFIKHHMTIHNFKLTALPPKKPLSLVTDAFGNPDEPMD